MARIEKKSEDLDKQRREGGKEIVLRFVDEEDSYIT